LGPKTEADNAPQAKGDKKPVAPATGSTKLAKESQEELNVSIPASSFKQNFLIFFLLEHFE